MIKWIGTIGGIIGAVLVSMNSGLQYIGYAAFLLGSLAWFYASVQQKDKAGFIQWGFFSIINFYGIINYWGIL